MNFIKQLFSKTTVLTSPLYYPKLLVFTGAGLSAESGIPTYRDGQDNLWQKYDAKVYSNYKTWYSHKEEVFQFWNDRKTEILKAEPNMAHRGLAQLQQDYPTRMSLTTQNIDPLLEKAGCKNVLHVHGDLYHMECKKCDHVWHVGDNLYNYQEVCSQCQSNEIKPRIVLFGENAPSYVQLYNIFNFRQRTAHDVILCVGTSFKVCKLDDIIGYGDYQPGFKILANYEAQGNIPEARFNQVYYGKVTENWQDIEEVIRERLKPVKL